LPIVAANLSRADAMKIAMGDASRPKDVSDALWRAQQEAIADGHCRLLPEDALPGMARAQIERDRTLAASIAPYAQRGVVLLTGNEHARRDIGVPHWLRAKSKSIGLLEDEDDIDKFDAYLVTERQSRPDPCEELKQRFKR
jgi:uncharacterized iron-regulated protein